MLTKLKNPNRREQWISFGEAVPGMRLKMAEIIPDNGTYVISIYYHNKKAASTEKQKSRMALAEKGGCRSHIVLPKYSVCGSPARFEHSVFYGKKLVKSGALLKSVNQ